MLFAVLFLLSGVFPAHRHTSEPASTLTINSTQIQRWNEHHQDNTPILRTSDYLEGTITDLQVIVDKTVFVTGSVRIESGGVLVVINSTLIIDNDDTFLDVAENSNLTIRDSKIYPLSNNTWSIRSEPDSKLIISESELVGSGQKDYGGITIRSDNAIIENSIITDFGGDIINVDSAENVLIKGNEISKSGWEGINLGKDTNTHIIGNKIRNTGYCGIFGSDSKFALIKNNTIVDTTYSGIDLADSGDAHIDSNRLMQIGQNGVNLEVGSRATVSNNTILGTGGSGFLFRRISQSTINNNQINDQADNGIHIYEFSHDSNITGNIIGGATNGIVISSSYNMYITENDITNSTQDGVSIIDRSHDVTLLMNNITSSDGIGLRVVGGEDIKIVGTILNESRFNDILIKDTRGGTIYLNGFCSSIAYPVFTISSFVHWDNGSFGNYWSNYDGTDTDNDLIGDDEYFIDASNSDRFPIINTDALLDFIERYVPQTFIWQSPDTLPSTTNLLPDDVLGTTDQQLALLLLWNSIVQLVGISLIVFLILHRIRIGQGV